MIIALVKFVILLLIPAVSYILFSFVYSRKGLRKELKEQDKTWKPFLKVLTESNLYSIVEKVQESKEMVAKSSIGCINFEIDGKSCYLGGPPVMNRWCIAITDKETKEVWWYSSTGLDRYERF